jgi:hypothetical protein
MNIDEPLMNLMRPPKMKFSNYGGSHTQYLSSFSSFRNSLKSFDSCLISFTLLKNIKSSDRPKTCVVYSHSHGSNGEESFEVLSACQATGLSLCYYDSRGCGASGDSFVTFGVNESNDLLYVCFYLIVIYNLEEFILWGRSIGSCAVLQMISKLTRLPNDLLTKKLKTLDTIENILQSEINKKEIDFIYEHFALFLALNNFINEEPRQFSVAGMVLDSPPKSIMAAIENFVKVKLLNFKLFTKMAAIYSEGWIKKQIGIDITLNQNLKLVKHINLNAIFLVSTKDEMVPFEDSMELVKNFSAKCDQKCFFDVFRMNKSHKEKRDPVLYEKAIQVILDKKSTKNSYRYIFELSRIREGGLSKKHDCLNKKKSNGTEIQFPGELDNNGSRNYDHPNEFSKNLTLGELVSENCYSRMANRPTPGHHRSTRQNIRFAEFMQDRVQSSNGYIESRMQEAPQARNKENEIEKKKEYSNLHPFCHPLKSDLYFENIQMQGDLLEQEFTDTVISKNIQTKTDQLQDKFCKLSNSKPYDYNSYFAFENPKCLPDQSDKKERSSSNFHDQTNGRQGFVKHHLQKASTHEPITPNSYQNIQAAPRNPRFFPECSSNEPSIVKITPYDSHSSNRALPNKNNPSFTHIENCPKDFHLLSTPKSQSSLAFLKSPELSRKLITSTRDHFTTPLANRQPLNVLSANANTNFFAVRSSNLNQSKRVLSKLASIESKITTKSIFGQISINDQFKEQSMNSTIKSNFQELLGFRAEESKEPFFKSSNPGSNLRPTQSTDFRH